MMARAKAEPMADETGDERDHEAAAESGAEPRVNKSEEIRAEARRLLEDGQQPRPTQIVRLLATRGIEVAPAMASTVLKKMGLQSRPRRAAAAAKRAGPPRREPTAADADTAPASGESFTLHQLIAAKKFVEMVGSPKQALALLDALDRLM